MTCLHLEDVPEDLAREIHRVARRQHESVSQIAIAILRRALLSPRARQPSLFARAPHGPRTPATTRAKRAANPKETP